MTLVWGPPGSLNLNQKDFHSQRATIQFGGSRPHDGVEENARISILYLASNSDDAELEREIIHLKKF